MTDEQLIEELSFPVYRRTSTDLRAGRLASWLRNRDGETINPRDLDAAQDRDEATEARCLSLAKP